MIKKKNENVCPNLMIPLLQGIFFFSFENEKRIDTARRNKRWDIEKERERKRGRCIHKAFKRVHNQVQMTRNKHTHIILF